jgi:hypothetical protein
MTHSLKKRKAEGSSILKHKKGKRQPAKEKASWLKRKNPYHKIIIS